MAEMIYEYDAQLEVVDAALKAVDEAAAALKKAELHVGKGRSCFPGGAKDFNKVMKCVSAADGKIWDAKTILSGIKSEILSCQKQDEAEPDLDGWK